MPGCQVLVAHKQKVIYQKSFGNHTYRRRRSVKINDLYDIASVTKAAATTLATIKMIDERKLSLSGELGNYFKDTEIILDSLEKEDFTYLNDTLHWRVAMDSLAAWQRGPEEVEIVAEESASFKENSPFLLAH